jgi:hypothetical protein
MSWVFDGFVKYEPIPGFRAIPHDLVMAQVASPFPLDDLELLLEYFRTAIEHSHQGQDSWLK